MAALKDILYRTAANIGVDADTLQSYADALSVIVMEAHRRGEDVELMTFGTLHHEGDYTRFHPHASLLPPRDGDDT